jgi:hypothetical protein
MTVNGLPDSFHLDSALASPLYLLDGLSGVFLKEAADQGLRLFAVSDIALANRVSPFEATKANAETVAHDIQGAMKWTLVPMGHRSLPFVN